MRIGNLALEEFAALLKIEKKSMKAHQPSGDYQRCRQGTQLNLALDVNSRYQSINSCAATSRWRSGPRLVCAHLCRHFIAPLILPNRVNSIKHSSSNVGVIY